MISSPAARRTTDREAVLELHRAAPLTDVHVHPSLKAYLFRRNLWRHYWSGKTFDPFSSRSDFETLFRGGVRVIWSSLHLPERQWLRDCCWLRLVGPLVLPAYRKLTTGRLFDRLLEMMDAFEREVRRRPDRTELARSAAAVRRIAGAGKIAVVHTVEGAHVLEGELDHLDVLAERGVAMLTLAHLYANGVATQVDGVPKDMFLRKLCRFDFQASPPPLTPFGRALLDRMKALRMIVDVTHCSRAAREAVYERMNGERPVVASHVGVARWKNDPYNLTDEEIREIARSGGVVGIILMTYWLDEAKPKKGLDAIWRTAEQVRDLTGSWEHVVLGTDFDGFTDPPDDVPDASHLGAVTAMLRARGVSDADILKILGGNAQRVLEAGWR